MDEYPPARFDVALTWKGADRVRGDGHAIERQYRGLNNDAYLGKADWNVANNQTLNVRWNANRFTGSNFGLVRGICG